MAVTFTLPRSFDPLECLSGRLALHADPARWLVSTVLRKTADRSIDLWGLVRLDSTILRRVMGRRSSGVVKALFQGGAIETANHQAGVRCRGYRLASRYLGDRCVRRQCVDPHLIGRLNAEKRRLDALDTRAAWLPIHHDLAAEQRCLSIDGPEAERILDGLPEHIRLPQDVLVNRLKRKAFHFSVGSTGRVFGAISNLKRELRRAVRLDGKRIGCVDICCSQPTLLVAEMLHETPANGLKGRATYMLSSAVSPLPLSCPFSASSYRSLVLDGSLYERLMELTGLPRDKVKLGLLRNVLAKRGRYPSPIEDAFRRNFPEEYFFVKRVNRHDHAELIRRLQRRESWLVIENVAPRLVGRVPVVTLHDAIFSQADKLQVVEAAFHDVFDEIGFEMSLKREGVQ